MSRREEHSMPYDPPPFFETYVRPPYVTTRAAATALGFRSTRAFRDEASSRERRKHDPPILRVPPEEMPPDADHRTVLWYREAVEQWGVERAARRARRAAAEGTME